MGEPSWARALLIQYTPIVAIGNHEANAHWFYDFLAQPGNEHWFAYTYGNAFS